jgi:hypothetical protein
MRVNLARSALLICAAAALIAHDCWAADGAPGRAGEAPLHRESTLEPAALRATRIPREAPPAAPSDPQALGGYDVLIADRGNNRLLIVSPDKEILWQYDFVGLPPASGADDAFFADGGKRVIVNLEHQQVIQVIEIDSKKVVWEYGHLGKRGREDGYLDFPDDAYKLPDGNVIVADIRNCRILEIAPDKRIVRQAGVTGRCGAEAPLFASPNGDTPLPNGHLLVSTIRDHALIELDENWNRVLRLVLPLRYPSDPQLTKAGNFLVCAYDRPGKIIEIDRAGNVLWSYDAKNAGGLNRPSLAMELPNGNVLATDDLNHRVIAVDKASQAILWQYGVTGRRGTKPGYLHIPDGLDIIKAR